MAGISCQSGLQCMEQNLASAAAIVEFDEGHWQRDDYAMDAGFMGRIAMYAIESVENNRMPGDLPLLRVEIKVGT
jgi:hypothetical protein